MTAPAMRERMRQQLADHMDREFTALLTGTVTTAPAERPLTIDRLNAMMRNVERLSREHRRAGMTVVVAQGHHGDVIIETHPTDGQFAEMSWQQAQAVHERAPLVLVEVLTPDRAHFRPAHSYDRFVPRILPAPPYEMLGDAIRKDDRP